MKKRLLALGLSAVMAVSLLACGSTESGSTEVDERPDFVYVPEYSDWDIEQPENGYINTYGVLNGYMLGMMRTYDNEKGTSVQEFLRYSLADNTLVKIPYISDNDNEYVNNVTLQPDGSLVVCAEEYIWDEKTETGASHYRIVNLAEDGAVTGTIDLDEICKELEDKYDYLYIQNIAVDTEGVIYLTFEQEVVAVNADGSKAFDIETGSWIQGMGNMPDGSVYVFYYSNEGKNVLAVIDKEAKSFGTTYELGNSNPNGFYSIVEGNVMYYSDSSAVHKLDLETGANEVLFDWLSADINGQYVQGVHYVDENTIMAYYRDWSTDEESFVKVVKTDASLVPVKEILTMAALMSDSEIQQDVVAFNKASDTHRIELKTYLNLSSMTSSDYENYEQYISDAQTRMLNDITGKNPPDIIVATEGYINKDVLVEKGILEELTPYLEQAGYQVEDFVQGVVNSYAVDGKLYMLPSRFTASTLMADSAIVGDKAGWTLKEALEILKNLPAGVSYSSYTTPQSFVQQCLMYGYSMFVDEQKGTCNFDSDEFKAVLEMAKTFPKEYIHDEDAMSPPLRVQNGEILTWDMNIYNLQEIQMGLAVFGDKKPTFIGYPGVAGNGALIQGTGGNYAICTKSEYKDVAADFIIDIITEPYDTEDYSSWGLPVLQKDLESYIESELEIEYIKDEKGELILDEEGNPIPEKGYGGVGYGDWEYTYRPCTREEADIMLEIINGACATNGSFNTAIYSLIMEDVEAYLNDQRSVDDVAALIQNRVSLYLMENS